MLALIFYYLVFGAIAMAMGIALFKRWDRRQSDLALNAFLEHDWLKHPSKSTQEQRELSAQEIYDFSDKYIATLKAAFASPTPLKLQRLNEVLAAPHNLHDQLWRDMAIRLSEVYDSYKIEYVALLTFVAENSENSTQLYASLRLATGFPEASTKLQRLATNIENSSEIEPALRTAKKLR